MCERHSCPPPPPPPNPRLLARVFKPRARKSTYVDCDRYRTVGVAEEIMRMNPGMSGQRLLDLVRSDIQERPISTAEYVDLQRQAQDLLLHG